MTATVSIKIADAGERTSALRRARINSVFVRILRWILPVVAVALMSSYAIFMQRTISVETKTHTGKLNTGTLTSSLDNLAMANPSYEGYNKKDGSRYKVSAKKAITDLSRDKPIQLIDIKGSLEQRNGQRTEIKASRGLFDQKRGTLNLDGGITVDAPNDLSVALNSAIIDTKTSEISSREPVLVKMPAGEVRGNSMHLDQRAREILFGDGVAAQLKPGAGPAGKPKQAAAQKKGGAGSVLGFGGGSDAPVDITAASLVITEKQRTARFKGNVHAVQNGRTLQAPDLLVSFAGSASFASLAQGQAPPTGGATAAPRTRLQRITASNGVKLTQGENEVRARTAIFDVEAHQAELSGGVKITSGANRTINSDLATIDTKSRRIVLTGRVAAMQEGNLLRGNRLTYAPNSGHMNLTSPAIGGAPRDNIFVRFKPPAAKNGRKPKRQTTDGITGGGAFSTNPDAPIEITARSLDVRDTKAVARFEGNVHARQGDLHLSTPLMTAHYDGQIGLFRPQSGSRRAKPKPMKLRFIRATNPVTVTSGEDMNASGENAEFDMLANTVTISGNVVLKQGRQIVRGDRLVIDLKTGQSRMKNSGKGRNTSKRMTFGVKPKITADPKRRDCGGQMCAVFYPMDVEKQKAGKKTRGKAKRKPKLDSGWSTSTNTN